MHLYLPSGSQSVVRNMYTYICPYLDLLFVYVRVFNKNLTNMKKTILYPVQSIRQVKRRSRFQSTFTNVLKIVFFIKRVFYLFIANVCLLHLCFYGCRSVHMTNPSQGVARNVLVQMSFFSWYFIATSCLSGVLMRTARHSVRASQVRVSGQLRDAPIRKCNDI